jgi:hypothetical protein
VRRDLARTIVAQNFGLLELRASRMSLEDVFLSLTTEEKEPEQLATPGQPVKMGDEQNG